MNHLPFFSIMLLRQQKEKEQLKAAIRQFAPASLTVIARNEAEFQERLDWLDYHLIFSDYHLPGQIAQKANMLANIKAPHVPFIYVIDQPQLARQEQSFQPRVKARLLRSELCSAGPLLEAIFTKAFHNSATERSCRAKWRTRALLLQKFMCLQKDQQGEMNEVTMEELAQKVFGETYRFADDVFSYYY